MRTLVCVARELLDSQAKWALRSSGRLQLAVCSWQPGPGASWRGPSPDCTRTHNARPLGNSLQRTWQFQKAWTPPRILESLDCGTHLHSHRLLCSHPACTMRPQWLSRRCALRIVCPGCRRCHHHYGGRQPCTTSTSYAIARPAPIHRTGMQARRRGRQVLASSIIAFSLNAPVEFANMPTGGPTRIEAPEQLAYQQARSMVRAPSTPRPGSRGVTSTPGRLRGVGTAAHVWAGAIGGLHQRGKL